MYCAQVHGYFLDHPMLKQMTSACSIYDSAMSSYSVLTLFQATSCQNAQLPAKALSFWVLFALQVVLSATAKINTGQRLAVPLITTLLVSSTHKTGFQS